MDQTIKILSEIERSEFVYRIFLNSDEKKLCNKLVKSGLLEKGKPAEQNATIAFFITNKGQKFLDSLKWSPGFGFAKVG